MYIKDEIVYPIFLKCCKFCTNNFWVNIFTDLSKSIAPYGTYISKDYFCCSYKNKEFSYKIDEKLDPETVYNDIITLLKNKLKLTSLNEKLEQIDILKNKTDEVLLWSGIRKKSSRKLLIEQFVIDKSKQYNLNLKQQKCLLNLIYYFMLIKTITHKDIIIADKKITHIEGISFSNQSIEIEEKLKQIAISETISKSVINNNMKNNWAKYLKDIYKLSHNIE